MELEKFRDVDLVIDHVNDSFNFKPFVSQNDNDGRTLTVQVTNGGAIGEIPGIMMNLRWSNQSSGLTDLSAFELIDKQTTKFQIKYPKNMLNPGKVIASIQIVQNGQVAHSKQFEIIVQQLAGETKGIIQKAEYSALVSILADSNKFRTDIDQIGMNIDQLGWNKVDKNGNEQITPAMLSKPVLDLINGSNVDVNVNTSMIEIGAVNPNRTDFVESVTQYVSEEQKIEGKYWSGSVGQKAGLAVNANYIAYNKIPVFAGKTYYVYQSRLANSTLMDENEIIIKYLSQTDVFENIEIVPEVDGYIGFSRSKNNAETKLFDVSKKMLDQLKIDAREAGVGLLTTQIPTLEMVDRSISAEKTDFLKTTEQFLDREHATKDAYWYFSGEIDKPIGMTTGATGLYAFDKVRIKNGETFSVLNARLSFSGVSDLKGNKLIQFSASDVTGDIEYTANQDCYIHISAQSSIPKLINLPLNQISNEMYDSKKGVIGIKIYDFILKEPDKENVINVSDVFDLISVIKKINDSSKSNQYRIDLAEGNYDLFAGLGGDAYLSKVESEKAGEMYGLNLPDYVNLRGIGKVLLSFEIPDSKATSETSKRISPLSIFKNHVIENIEIIGKNVRYACHDETGNGFHGAKKTFKNVVFRHLGNVEGLWPSTQAYAAGTGSNGEYYFENCTFDSVKSAFSIHDNLNQKSNKIYLDNCKFLTGSDYSIRFGTYGTGSETHEVFINNCNIDKYIYVMEESQNSKTGMRFKLRGGGNTKVPYWTVNSAGPRLPIEFSDETATVVNSGSEDISIGEPVKMTEIGKVSKITKGQEFLFFGVALETIPAGMTGVVKTTGYLSRDDTPFGSLTVNSKIGIENGQLAITTGSEFIGFVPQWRNILLK